jgi:Arc/MetJ-type ribon-helix-helix transcriptional regulator
MKTLTVRLPDTLVAEIEREAQARRVSKSDVVRERLHQPRRAPASGGAMDELIGDILEESWKAKVPAGPPRFRSPKKQRLAEIIRAKKLHRR